MTVDRITRSPKVGDTYRLPETVAHPPVEAKITGFRPGVIEYIAGAYKGSMRTEVFVASAIYLGR